MASKRMFSNQVIDTDKFRNLGQSAQALYFHLGMDCDDDGFVSFRKAERLCGFKIEDLRSLNTSGFVEVFESGIVAIVHFHINNWLDKRRTKPTVFQRELAQLTLDSNKVYMLSERLADAKQMLREYRVEENRIEEAGKQKEGATLNWAEKEQNEKQRRRELARIESERRKEIEKELKKMKEKNEKEMGEMRVEYINPEKR